MEDVTLYTQSIIQYSILHSSTGATCVLNSKLFYQHLQLSSKIYDLIFMLLLICRKNKTLSKHSQNQSQACRPTINMYIIYKQQWNQLLVVD